MMRLLEWLIRGHVHEWETIDERRFNWSNDFGEHGTCTRFYLRCKKCGWVRAVDCK